jgi:hypothetical protein
VIEIDVKSPSGLSSNGRPFGSKSSNGLYWRVQIAGKQVYCHRLIWERVNGPIPDGKTVDHINRDGLDNRIENLRLADKSRQMLNRDSYGSVPYKFVQKGRPGAYRARYRVPGGGVVSVGTFSDPYKAHLAALAHRLEHLWHD